jgi:hypothetical protein
MTKKILFVFGLLDLLSFSITCRFLIKLFENLSMFSIAEMLLIVSLIASGVLSIMKKRISLIIYYFQFPLRISFMILTFSFLNLIFALQYNTIGHRILFGVVTLFEIFRLVISIMVHRKEYRG